MKKRIIRILTFVFGLYFVLEFLLPKEIGGDFDKLAVSDPAVVSEGEGAYRLYYVGKYDAFNEAIGLAQGQDDSPPVRSETGPVLKSNLFSSYDRAGFSGLAVLKNGGAYELFYFGHEPGPEKNPTICRATSEDGFRWEKHGRLQFKDEVPWRQRYEVDRSYRRYTYARLLDMAATSADGETELYVAYFKEGSSAIRIARQKEDGTGWVLDENEMALGDEIRESMIVGVSAASGPYGMELWIRTDQGIYRQKVGSEELPKKVAMQPQGVPSGSGFSVFYNGKNYVGFFSIDYKYEKDDEVITSSSILMAESPDGNEWNLEGIPSIETTLVGGQGVLTDQGDGGGSAAEGIQLAMTRKADPEPWENWFSKWTTFAGDALGVIGAFAIGLGVVNLCLVHGKNLLKSRKQVHNSVAFFVVLIGMFALTLVAKPYWDKMSEAKVSKLENVEEYQKKELEAEVWTEYHEKSPVLYWMGCSYDFLYTYILLNLGTTVFSLISFYMVGAAFRSFRIKSLEALLLVVSAMIVMLGQIPIGEAITSWIPWTSQKLLTVVNAAAYRGVVLGMTVGALSMSLRLWLGLERGMFHGTD